MEDFRPFALAFFVVFYSIIANIPFWIASYWLGLLPLGWFCLEYAGVGLLALFLPRTIAGLLLLLVSAADLISGVSKTYYLSPTECLSNFTSLQQFPAMRLIGVAVVAVLILLVAAIAIALPVARMRGTYRRGAATGLIAFIALGLSLDCAAVVRETGHIPNPFDVTRPTDSDRYSETSNLWMSRYPLIRLVRDERLFGRNRDASRPDFSPVPGAIAVAVSAQLVEAKRGQEKPNVVLVLLESWGIEKDSSVRLALVQPYAHPDLLARYQVLQGKVPFYGSTVAGEARELCGNRIGLHIMNLSPQALQNCLPGRLAAQGYHSMALHGMDARMFNRSAWWSNIGFQEQWFRDRFLQQGLPNCIGAFTGICDASIAEWIGHSLGRKTPDPEFVYWVTLNSHLPLPLPSSLPVPATCSVTPYLSQQPALCSWYQLVSNVHESVSQIAMGNLARPTVFVIVGDHAPPFANPALRSQFSSTDVPYVILMPRSTSGISNQVR